ncbi:prion-inhibition and propagation-domain-containing protein [Rhypophila decipiens]|uniref:Prion-inhibition and propagation-domain-containing protein n=1 Tax=Rhypophila decipiens TaxID=261697 RepID=A0AAN7BDN2_9PEZI|nr:prion-inhibition and propagation-domain-containing protein [Rhypophila decipiens]
MEAAGLGAGVVSLAFDVFDNTIRLFKFISALVDMPKDCEKYRLQLIMEYNRVLAWGKAAGLVDIPEGQNLASTLGTNSMELVSIVARIQWLLAEFRDINGRHGNEFRPDKGDLSPSEKQLNVTDIDVLRQISSLAVSYESKTKERRFRRGLNHIRGFVDKASQSTKEIITHPSRVRWVMVDQDAFETLLKDLHILTERLHELMRHYRQSKIDDITARTYREMIITRNGVQDLRDMLDAVTGLVATSTTTNKGTSTSSNSKALQDLVRLKKISQRSEMILSQLFAAKSTHDFDLKRTLSDLDIKVQRYTPDLWNDRFWLNKDGDVAGTHCRRPRGVLSTPEGDIQVWIEYKTLDRFTPGSLKDKESALRTVALAEMLHIPKPASLHVPECVGYFDGREIGKADRYGWIFRMDEGSDSRTEIRSLYEMLGDQHLKPTLSQRLSMAYKLCSTVLNLHAANWLHKGIFSDNVTFHCPSPGYAKYDPTSLCLSGFEFSRPEGTDTTLRESDLAWDLYRWPGIQRQPPLERNSRKTYDLYSLGLVLLEIAHWEPLWKILGLSPGATGGDHVEQGGGVLPRHPPPIVPYIPLSQSKQVRTWLLGLHHKIDKYTGAVTTSAADTAPCELEGKPNPVQELRNIMGDRYCQVVTRCLYAHGEKGFGVDEDKGEGIKLQEAFTRYVVEELEGIVV